MIARVVNVQGGKHLVHRCAEGFACGDYEQATARKRTKRERFLSQMEAVVPWRALIDLIARCYPKTGSQGGRAPYPLATDVLLTVKSYQKTLYRQISCQFQGKRQIPFTATDHEKCHGRDTVWELRAKEAPEHIKANWPGSAWIVEVISDTVERNGKRGVRRHLFLTSVRTTLKALLRLIRQRWSLEKDWHWARDAQLGEDAVRYTNRTGSPVFSFLRTIMMSLCDEAVTAPFVRDSKNYPTASRECWHSAAWPVEWDRPDRTFRQLCRRMRLVTTSRVCEQEPRPCCGTSETGGRLKTAGTGCAR